jgi:hypothetical protein
MVVFRFMLFQHHCISYCIVSQGNTNSSSRVWPAAFLATFLRFYSYKFFLQKRLIYGLEVDGSI